MDMDTQPASTASEVKPSDSLTEAQLLEQLLGSQQPEEHQEEGEQPAQEEQPEGEGEPEQSEEQEPEGEPEGEDELPTDEDSLIEQILALPPEQQKELARKAGTRGLSRIAELTAKNKALENQLEVTRQEAKPLPKPIPDNPFASLKTLDDLEKKAEEMEKVVEVTNRILDDNEDYGSDDVIHREGDKEFTKKEVRKANRNAREALTKFLPAQGTEIRKIEELAQRKEAIIAAIPQEVPEVADPESELGQFYQEAMKAPLSVEVMEKVPEFGAILPLLLAHYTRSYRGTKPTQKAIAPGQLPKPRAAGSPVGASATATRIDPAAKVKEKQAKFYESGNADDMVAMFAASHQ